MLLMRLGVPPDAGELGKDLSSCGGLAALFNGRYETLTDDGVVATGMTGGAAGRGVEVMFRSRMDLDRGNVEAGTWRTLLLVLDRTSAGI
jgi:hypothetical protein